MDEHVPAITRNASSGHSRFRTGEFGLRSCQSLLRILEVLTSRYLGLEQTLQFLRRDLVGIEDADKAHDGTHDQGDQRTFRPCGLDHEAVALLGAARILWLAIGALWLLRQVQRVATRHSLNVTRVVVMTTTWLTWYLGIVHFNSDVAFTITNVLPHGVPYFVLLFRYYRSAPASTRSAARSPWIAVLLFYLPLALLAFAEEGLWDRLLWHEHALFFPIAAVFISQLSTCFLVPLLALPQATHYLLDAWIWRVGSGNPDLKRRLRL